MDMDWSHCFTIVCAENPKLRKLALHRIFHGDMGVDCSSLPLPEVPRGNTIDATCNDSDSQVAVAPVTLLTVPFVVNVLLPAYDGIGSKSNVEYFDESKKEVSKDTVTLVDLEGKLKRS
jgi:hypothetical protein